LKIKKLPGSKPKDVLPKKGNELKTSKDRKKKNRDNPSSERLRTSSTEPMSCTLKSKNLKSKQSKCARLYKRSMMRFLKCKPQLTTLPAPVQELIIGAKSLDSEIDTKNLGKLREENLMKETSLREPPRDSLKPARDL
jgi:hypothetical protein